MDRRKWKDEDGPKYILVKKSDNTGIFNKNETFKITLERELVVGEAMWFKILDGPRAGKFVRTTNIKGIESLGTVLEIKTKRAEYHLTPVGV